MKNLPDFSYENKFKNKIVVGIDEAGRGPLAGPVIAAAVLINKNSCVNNINDSKKLNKNTREKIFQHIIDNFTYAIGIASVQEIDKINILQATKLAMNRAITNLNIKPDIALIDGNFTIPSTIPNYSIIKGDQKSLSIAAASIVAKVTRDRIMYKLHYDFPQYDWINNVGYGTKKHILNIKNFGISPYHRKSFAPIKLYF